MSNNNDPSAPQNPPPATGNDLVPKDPSLPPRPNPRDPLFDVAPNRPAYDPTAPSKLGDNAISTLDRKRMEELKKLIGMNEGKLPEPKPGSRAERFLPYLLVRSFAGDRGNRPYGQPGQPPQVFWESPDIWVAEGDPSTAPDLPADIGGFANTAGVAHTLYAHVWNLGRAPILGVRVEFYVFDPTFVFDRTNALFYAMARVDLAPRTSDQCHKLVKCPMAWVPSSTEHQCLVVRVSSIGDTLGSAHPWDSWAERHVAQRNVQVVSAGGGRDLTGLLGALERTRPPGTRVQLLQVGNEAANVVRLASAKLTVDPAVQSHVLAELGPDGSLALPAGAAGVGPLDVPRIVPSNFSFVKPMAAAPSVVAAPSVTAGAAMPVLAKGASMTTLLDHANQLHPTVAAQIQAIAPPQPGMAQVLRFACYQGDQVVGGYTLIVQG